MQPIIDSDMEPVSCGGAPIKRQNNARWINSPNLVIRSTKKEEDETVPKANKADFIATIGYEGVGFGDFALCLREAGIKHVIDVRELPLSRRAGFSKRQLAAGLSEFGIAYSHLKGLGTPKEGRIAARAKRMDEFEAIFSAHMTTANAQTELRNAADLVVAEPCCLVCYEADPACCHRSVVATALQEITGLPIKNLAV